MCCRVRTGPGAEVGYEMISDFPPDISSNAADVRAGVDTCQSQRGCELSHGPCGPGEAIAGGDGPGSAPSAMGGVIWTVIIAAIVIALAGGFLLIRLKGGM